MGSANSLFPYQPVDYKVLDICSDLAFYLYAILSDLYLCFLSLLDLYLAGKTTELRNRPNCSTLFSWRYIYH